jgi:DNA repair photolyase
MITKLTPQRNLTGDREWAKYKMNFVTGCQNQCKYCFSCAYSYRVARVLKGNWKTEIVRQHDLNRKIKKYDGPILFPASHDISLASLEVCVDELRRVLSAGNEVFFITKAHLEVIDRICREFSAYKDQMLVCVTIGSINSETLKFWEIGATSFEERFEALKLAHGSGFRTSVSAEPMLDKNIVELIETLSPFVSNEIWIGKFNDIRQTLTRNGHNDAATLNRANELKAWQSDPSCILPLYEKYKNNPKIQWKETYRGEILNDYSKRC